MSNLNETTKFTTVISFEDRLTATLVLGGIALLGTIVNGIPVVLTFATKMRKQNVNIFFGNMAIADFATSFIFLVGQPFIMLNPDYWHSELCNWIGFLQFVAAFETVTFIPYLSVNRYICLCHHHLYDKIYTKRGINIMTAASWIIVILVVAPYKIGGLTGFDEDNLHCCIKYAKDVFWDAYYLTFTFTPIVFADLVSLYASYRVYRSMKHESGNFNDHRNVAFYKEIQLYTILDVLIPVVLLLPYFAVKYAYADRSILWVRILMTVFFMSVPLLRGVNTILVLRPYKRALRRIFGRKAVDTVTQTGTFNTRGTTKKTVDQQF